MITVKMIKLLTCIIEYMNPFKKKCKKIMKKKKKKNSYIGLKLDVR